MKKYKKHIFICENIRNENHPIPSCGREGGIENRVKLKRYIRELRLSQSIRVNSSGCLGMCHHAPAAVIYPEGKWLGEIKIDDIEEILNDSLIGNKSLTRLEIDE